MRIVEIAPYNPDWVQMFAEEAKRLELALGDNCVAVHHIGSTAVPELAAKSVIDILPVVKDILEVDKAICAMQDLGYEAKGEHGILFRRYFQKGGDLRSHHVHIFEEGNSEIDRYLKFRDWMRTHADDRQAYAALKQSLAKKYRQNILEYCFGKDAFVAEIDTKTGSFGLRLVKALTPREWDTARRLRQEYFFDDIGVADPYTWTFDYKGHIHLIAYQGSPIIGYVHIQTWNDLRVAIRIIVVEKKYQNKGYGGQILELCERWLKQQGFQSLHVQSSAEAYRFFINRGYSEMPFKDSDGHATDPRDIELGKIL
ncbi:MAG: uncharacterized protein K0S74_792 [Chlamydiales bacterium]|jgi:GrpB-like predicted nucleotidyltransferase (UPF0157 family)|nr:uncharacterized protein [Chlamydiales bacterium]